MTKVTHPNRVAWVDFAKGIGIFLVVFGHTLRGLFTYGYAPNTGALQWIDSWIYAFHMPLFFFVSGLFIQRSAQRGWGEFAKRKVGSIIYPYLVWSLLQGALLAVTKPQTTTLGDLAGLWRISYDPRDHFWFLYSLMVITVLFWVCEKIRPLWLFVGLSIALFSGYILDLQLAISPAIDQWPVFYITRPMLLYFALGAIVIRQPWFAALQNRSIGQLVTLASLAVAALSALVTVALAIAQGQPLDTVLAYRLCWPLMAAVGIAAVVLFSLAIARSGKAQFLETWGRLSLQIYVAHVIFTAVLRIISQKLFKTPDPILFLIFGTAIGMVGPIGLDWLSQRFNMPYLFALKETPSAKT
jgi:fucose 4-O-acetylase-like acetyltransferase